MLISAFHLTGATYPNLTLPSRATGMIFQSICCVIKRAISQRIENVHTCQHIYMYVLQTYTSVYSLVPRLPSVFNIRTDASCFSACIIEKLGTGPGNEATHVLSCKIGTWLRLGVAKRAKTSVPSIVPTTWWGPGWTSGANTTPVVLSMHSCEFLARLQE